jgi:hypothetical protein
MPLHFNDTLEHAIRKVEENKVGLKLNYTRELLVYGDDINLLGENVSTVNKITETLIHSTKKVGFTALVKTARCWREQLTSKGHIAESRCSKTTG